MKTRHISIVIVVLSLIMPIASYAKTLINGLYYDFNAQTLEATVVSNSSGYYTASSINIPEEIKHKDQTYKITAIGSDAFRNAENLTSITIPQTVKYVGDNAFLDCIKLKSITLPNGLTRIEYGTFQGCHDLKSITIPEGVTTISQDAFSNCESLESIVLASSINFISPGAFQESTAIKSVTVNSPTPIAIYKNTFSVFGNLYVPKGSKEAYEKAAIWQDFNIIEEGAATGISNLNADNSSQNIYSISGTHLSTPRKGMNIINGKKVVIK